MNHSTHFQFAHKRNITLLRLSTLLNLFIMKSTVFIFLWISCFTINAQITEAELVRSAFKLEKKALVAEVLKLTNEEAIKFWPIYENYETARYTFGTKRIQLVEKYLRNLEQLTPITADEMVKESAELLSKELVLRTKYYKIIKKSVSTLVAARFYQIEDAINVEIRAELFSVLPLALKK